MSLTYITPYELSISLQGPPDALAIAAHNAAYAQQQANITMQAATVQGVNSLINVRGLEQLEGI